MTGVQIGAKPDSGFDDPIGMLTDCHRRIESFLRVLCRVAVRARGRRLSEEEEEAVASSLSYFRTGGERHTADEEESLFPRLKKHDEGKSLEGLHLLEADHQHAHKLHTAVEKLFSTWMESGGLCSSDEQTLLQSTVELDQIYKAHIKIEEEVVFPEASRVLDKESIKEMGEEFRARRN
jgi:hemerythrin-like domain-containing protein